MDTVFMFIAAMVCRISSGMNAFSFELDFW
jgi:hypothetical protein